MRREEEIKRNFKAQKNKDTVDFKVFVTGTLNEFSKKNEYEIHLLESILKTLKSIDNSLLELKKP